MSQRTIFCHFPTIFHDFIASVNPRTKRVDTDFIASIYETYPAHLKDTGYNSCLERICRNKVNATVSIRL